MEHPGYKYRCGQPITVLNLKIRDPGRFDVEALDRWLQEALAIEPITRMEDIDLQQVAPNVFLLAIRAFHVAQALLRVARVPVFDQERILHIGRDQKDENIFSIQAAIPTTDHFPNSAIVVAYQAAFSVTNQAASRTEERQDIEAIRKWLLTKVINPVRSTMPAGLSTVPILHEAWRKKIPFRHLGAGIYQLGWGSRARRLDRSSSDSDSAIGMRLSMVKTWTAQVLRSSGIPCPEHIPVSSEADALAAAKKLGWPVVLKPADRERSEGVTVGIDNPEALVNAYRYAIKLSKNILVERQIDGTCYRLMIANGELLYALWRRPISVIGNGHDSVSELIRQAAAEASKTPDWSRSKVIADDTLTADVVASQGLTPASVPVAGQRVALRKIESTEWGEDRGDATADVHPANVEVAKRAAKMLGLENAGVDIISRNISLPWYENGATVTEVNYAPHFGATSVARSKMPEFLDRFLGGNGRIPIEVFVGGNSALNAAVGRQRSLVESGLRCFLTTHMETWSPNSILVPLAAKGLFDRTLALLMDREVDALLLVCQNDEWVYKGAPVDQIDAVHVSSDFIQRVDPQLPGSADTQQMRLLRLLATLNKNR